MSTGLENAATVFEKEIGGGTAQPSGGVDETAGVETMFSNMGQLEVDDESPAVAGGDAEDNDAQPAPKPTRAKAQPKADEEADPDAELYGDEEADPQSKGPDDAEDEEDEDDDGEGGEYISEEEFEALKDRRVTVTVDGEEKDVPLSEAIDGYIRLDTFHQRMNEVDEARREIEGEVGNIQQSRAKVVAMLDEAQQLMEAVLPPEPDWDAMFAKDPGKARAIQKSYEEMRAKIDEVKAKRKAVLEEGSQEHKVRLARYKDMEAKKFDASNPNWVGEEGQKRKQKDINSMVRTGRAMGFSDQELSQVLDSRMLGILLKASKFDRMMAARKNKLPPARGKQLKSSGAGRIPATAPRGIDRAKKQLQRTGSVQDAVPVFQNLITRG